MKFKYPFIATLILLSWTTACHHYELYDSLWWSDMVAHFYAGIVLGLYAWYFIAQNSKLKNHSFYLALSMAMFALLFSFFWELFEYYLFITKSPHLTYYAGLDDTISDMNFGLSGGALVGIYYYVKSRKF
jgi:hypothetical protein